MNTNHISQIPHTSNKNEVSPPGALIHCFSIILTLQLTPRRSLWSAHYASTFDFSVTLWDSVVILRYSTHPVPSHRTVTQYWDSCFVHPWITLLQVKLAGLIHLGRPRAWHLIDVQKMLRKCPFFPTGTKIVLCFQDLMQVSISI